MSMRADFWAIAGGWTLIDDFDVLTDLIERLADWTKANGPLTRDEEATVALMIECQIEMVRSRDTNRVKGPETGQNRPKRIISVKNA